MQNRFIDIIHLNNRKITLKKIKITYHSSIKTQRVGFLPFSSLAFVILYLVNNLKPSTFLITEFSLATPWRPPTGICWPNFLLIYFPFSNQCLIFLFALFCITYPSFPAKLYFGLCNNTTINRSISFNIIKLQINFKQRSYLPILPSRHSDCFFPKKRSTYSLLNEI